MIRTHCNIFARSLFYFHPCFIPNSAFVNGTSELPDKPSFDALKIYFAKFNVKCLQYVSLWKGCLSRQTWSFFREKNSNSQVWKIFSHNCESINFFTCCIIKDISHNAPMIRNFSFYEKEILNRFLKKNNKYTFQRISGNFKGR